MVLLFQTINAGISETVRSDVLMLIVKSIHRLISVSPVGDMKKDMLENVVILKTSRKLIRFIQTHCVAKHIQF